MTTVDVPAAVAERLNSASAKRRWYPFDADVIDWSVPLDDGWSYMPAGRSAFTSNPDLSARWTPSQRSYIERWEMTQRMRNTAHGEHLLNQGILAMLWTVDPYDPSYRYLLHEVAEECQHMAMFNHWVRLNADIETTGAGETVWGRSLADFTEDLAVRLPEAFWVNVLLFEFVGDDFNQAMRARQEAPGADQRPLHPILVQIGHAHTAEEARHIAYARRWLHEGMGRLDQDQRREVQQIAELGVAVLIARRSDLLPLTYTSQLAPYLNQQEFDRCCECAPGIAAMLGQLKVLVEELAALEVVSDGALRRWSDDGCFG
jgi:hypothetical protein